MTAPGRDLLDYIVAHIEDDAPRLVYADWLEEHGHAVRAEFVRVQIERARLPPWDAAQVRLRIREAELLAEHGEAWLAEMPVIPGAKWEGFRRGVVAELSFSSFEMLRKHAHECRAVAPIEAVRVHWPRRGEKKSATQPIAELRELTLRGRPTPDEIERFAESPQLATLESLIVLGLDADDLTRLAASPHLTGLRELRLDSNAVGTRGVAALIASPSLKNLEVLDLSNSGQHDNYEENPLIDPAGMEALAGWSGLAKVRRLVLSGSDVQARGLQALVRSRHASALHELSLRGGRLDCDALVEFGAAVPSFRLNTLDLGENLFDSDDVQYFITAPCLRELKSLSLDRCEITPSGAIAFAKRAKILANLRQLDVSSNHFRADGVAALLDSRLPQLHMLRLRDNDLGDSGAALLAASPATNDLLDLDLSRSALGPAALVSLGAAQELRSLLALHIGENRLDGPMLEQFAASPLGQRLAVLDAEASPRHRD